MRNFIPPVASMRALEAAIRHESFSAAAEELGVTQSAISHKIKELEGHLGVPLFRRLARGTIPTESARTLGRAISSGTAIIHDAVEEIMGRNAGDTLTISALPGFAVQWLFPRLIDFDERNPGISISLGTSDKLTDIASGEADMAIRYGRGNYSGVRVEKLMDDHMFPVCSASYLSEHGLIESPADLRNHTLLIDETRVIDGYEPSWRRWFELADLPFTRSANFKKFGQSNMVIQAALAGRGVALGRSPLVIDEILAGNLVIPLNRPFPSGFSHYLISAKNRPLAPNVEAFRQWIKRQAAECNDTVDKILAAT